MCELRHSGSYYVYISRLHKAIKTHFMTNIDGIMKLTLLKLCLAVWNISCCVAVDYFGGKYEILDFCF